MGYTTEFEGCFSLNKELDDVTFDFLKKLNETRRMARNVNAKYGVEGEFYVDGGGMCGQAHEKSIIDFNGAPKTQPGLWCKWTPTEDRRGIEWDGAEKFYAYVEWLEYLISKVLAPRGYVLNGSVKFRGEESDDRGTIKIKDNVVDGKRLIVDCSINKLLGNPNGKSTPKKESPKKDDEKESLKKQIKELQAQLDDRNKLINYMKDLLKKF